MNLPLLQLLLLFFFVLLLLLLFLLNLGRLTRMLGIRLLQSPRRLLVVQALLDG